MEPTVRRIDSSSQASRAACSTNAAWALVIRVTWSGRSQHPEPLIAPMYSMTKTVFAAISRVT